MQTDYPNTRFPMYTPEFKAEVMKTILFNIPATADISSRYGVPPSHIRRWIRELVAHLCDVYSRAEKTAPPWGGQRVKKGFLTVPEICFLMRGKIKTPSSPVRTRAAK